MSEVPENADIDSDEDVEVSIGYCTMSRLYAVLETWGMLHNQRGRSLRWLCNIAKVSINSVEPRHSAITDLDYWIWGTARLLSNLCCIGNWPIRFLLQSRNWNSGSIEQIRHCPSCIYVCKLKPFVRAAEFWIWWQNPRHVVAISLVKLFRHHFWVRSILVTSLNVDFCWNWANRSNPTLGTSVTVRTRKRISWWHLKWPKRNLPSRNHSRQIGGGLLKHQLNSICFTKTASQRALRSKRTYLSLCGLSGWVIAPRILSRLMNVCTSSNKNLQPWLKKLYCSGFWNLLRKLGIAMGVSIRRTVCIKSAVGWAGL